MNRLSKFTNLLFCFCLWALFLALPAVGQANPDAVIQHIIILIRENRSFDHYFGSYPTGGPITGKCKPTAAGGLSSCPSSGLITLAPGNPNAADCGEQDCPHSALSLIDALDVTNGSAAMDGFGGYCSGGTQAQCWLGQSCSPGNTCNLAAYTYYDRTTIPFYWQMADLYGLGNNFFSYPNGPSYPNHLVIIAAQTNEALDEPYTHGSTNQWTCDEASVGGSQPVCSGTCRVGAASCTSNAACGPNNSCIHVTCTGGFTYESQTLSQALGDDSILGTPVQAGDYYYGGMCQDNVTPCICDTGQTLPGAMSYPGTCNSGFSGAFPHGGDSCGLAGTCNTASSAGNTRGGICPEVTTITDRLDAAGISWGYYAPLPNNVNGYFWTGPGYVQHIRYGPDWTTNVHGVPVPFDQAVTSCTSVSSCTLPSVVWVSSGFPNSEHPPNSLYPNATVSAGQAWTMARLQNIFNQPGQYVYNSSIIFVVWDDPGGFYDHVPPPTPGLGMRVPILCIGPYCKHGIINTQLEFGSILKCIENPPYVSGVNPQPWKLDNLGGRDVSAPNDACAAMVNLSQSPILAPTQLARSLTPPTTQPSTPTDRDLVRLAKQVYGWFHPTSKSRRRDEDESPLPTLATMRPCLDGTNLHRAYYVTKAGRFPVEVCGSDDGKRILWPGESHQDDDQDDRPKTHGRL